MITIVAGSRGITDYQTVFQAIQRSGFKITELVSGGARGVDLIGEKWAKTHGVKITRFLPDWAGLGRSAGHVRNREMGDYAEALVAIWDGESKGTKSMIDYATKKGLKVFVWNISDTS